MGKFRRDANVGTHALIYGADFVLKTAAWPPRSNARWRKVATYSKEDTDALYILKRRGVFVAVYRLQQLWSLSGN